MAELVTAYGIGALSTLIFVLVGCALEEIEARKTAASNRKAELKADYMKNKAALYRAEREYEQWEKKKAI